MFQYLCNTADKQLARFPRNIRQAMDILSERGKFVRVLVYLSEERLVGKIHRRPQPVEGKENVS